MPTPATARAALDAAGIEAICDLTLEGLSQRQIAERIGITDGSLRSWLTDDPTRSARVQKIRAETAQHWEEEAQRAITDARSDPVELTRARELAQHYRWRAAIINPQYRPAQKQEHSGPNGGPIQFEDTRGPLNAFFDQFKPPVRDEPTK